MLCTHTLHPQLFYLNELFMTFFLFISLFLPFLPPPFLYPLHSFLSSFFVRSLICFFVPYFLPSLLTYLLTSIHPSFLYLQILNLVYGSVSIQLNDYENHRTDTEYEDNLISKIFIFQLVNSFAALTYVSFIKYFLNIPCVRDDCIGDSASSLSTIFIVRLVTSAVVNVFVQKVI